MENTNYDPNKTPQKKKLSLQLDVSKFEKATEEEKRQQTQLSVPGYRFMECGTIGQAKVSPNGKKVKLGQHGLAVLVFEKVL